MLLQEAEQGTFSLEMPVECAMFSKAASTARTPEWPLPRVSSAVPLERPLLPEMPVTCPALIGVKVCVRSHMNFQGILKMIV